jgi:hypothetical protein
MSNAPGKLEAKVEKKFQVWLGCLELCQHIHYIYLQAAIAGIGLFVINSYEHGIRELRCSNLTKDC